jgi:hypothetical protein
LHLAFFDYRRERVGVLRFTGGCAADPGAPGAAYAGVAGRHPARAAPAAFKE